MAGKDWPDNRPRTDWGGNYMHAGTVIGVTLDEASKLKNGARIEDIVASRAGASDAITSLPTEDAQRKLLPILTFLTEYFPDAILEMVRVSVAGNIQHNPERTPADITWARGKSTDQLNTAFRHMWDHKRGVVKDTDGQYHLAKTAWRTLAELQLQIEKDRSANNQA